MRRTPKLPRCALLVAATLFIVPSVAACGAAAPRPAWTAPATTAVQATGHPSSEAPAPQAALAAWEARPDFVRADMRTEEAYAFALSAPDALQWIPCYCGCGAMGHTSNLDCFFKRTMAGLSSLDFEEHASFCKVCVDEALIVKQMLADGHSMREIRTAIDGQFGNLAPGTSTELPPA